MTNLKTIKAVALIMVLGLGMANSAQAGRSGDVAAALVVGGLLGAAATANRPVYVAQPTYAPGYYEPAPTYYAPPPVYVVPAPVYVAPAPIYVNPYRHHYYRHHRYHDRY